MKEIISKKRRVRKSTPEEMNQRIDEKTLQSIQEYARRSNRKITKRIKQLEEEWDIERFLELNMSTLALTGIALSKLNRKWMILPTVVLGFFVQHALQGWCPPLSVFRYFKKRTRTEIDQEKHALKSLRGDYSRVRTAAEAFKAARYTD